MTKWIKTIKDSEIKFYNYLMIMTLTWHTKRSIYLRFKRNKANVYDYQDVYNYLRKYIKAK